MTKRLQYWAGVSLIVGLVTLASLLFQKPLTYAGGLGWDGASYAAMAGQCWKEPMSAPAPFVFRVGAPCVAALLSDSAVRGLFYGNLMASTLAVFLLAVFLSRHVTSIPLRLALVAVYCLQWLGPLRYSWFYPTYVDPWFHLGIMAALVLLDRDYGKIWSTLALGSLVFVGTLFRETMLIVVVMAAARELPYFLPKATLTGRLTRMLFLGASGALAMALTHAVTEPTTKMGFVGTALFWAYTKPLPVWLYGVFIAFGPAIGLFVARRKLVLEFFAPRKDLAVFVAIVLALGFIGGTDTERFLFWAAPVVLALAGYVIERSKLTGVALAALASMTLISERWLFMTPDFVPGASPGIPLVTPIGAGGVSWLVAELHEGEIKVKALLLAQSLACAALAAWLSRARAPRA